MSCYRFFNGITGQLTQVKSGDLSSETLQKTCAILASQISTIKSGDCEISKPDYFELSLCYTAQKLALGMANNGNFTPTFVWPLSRQRH